MKRIVDCSIPLNDDILRWRVNFNKTYNTTSYQSTILNISVHAGTHIDAPLHYIDKAVDIFSFPVEMMIKKTKIINLTHIDENHPIDAEDIAEKYGTESIDSIVIKTEWYERKWGTDNYWLKSPYLTRDAANYLVEKGIKIVGYDFPQDYAIRHTLCTSGNDVLPNQSDFYVHEILTSNNIWQIEYLANMKKITEDTFTMICSPLPLQGVEGSPVRIIGVIGDDNHGGDDIWD